MDGCLVRLHAVPFKGSRSKFTAQPIGVNFHKLLQSSDAPKLLPEVENQEVLCAVETLFGVCLSDMSSREVHDIMCCHRAHTIILLREQSDVLEEYRSQRFPNPRRANRSPPPEVVQIESDLDRQFSGLFSETEESEVESSDESSSESIDDRWSWTQFSAELEEFLEKVRERHAQREAAGEEGEIPSSVVGVECLIVAAAVCQMRRLMTGEKVLQVLLLATRKRYRNCGVGRYIVELLKTQSLCSSYEVLLVNASLNAVEFFTRCGLTDDPLLNDKFWEVRDEWNNTTLMCYFPPFITESESRNPDFSLSLAELEMEVTLAKDHALIAYQQQAVCVIRLVNEVKTLRKQLELQKKEVENLSSKLVEERERRHSTERKFLEYKLRMTRQLLEKYAIDLDDEEGSDSLNIPDLDTKSVQTELETDKEGALNSW